jgi:2-amino-4-hydroxy-6-hydroxymethyldihydropteridine diphosphokinase
MDNNSPLNNKSASPRTAGSALNQQAAAAQSKQCAESGGSEAYIALGSNVGDREQLLTEALHMLQAHPAIEVLRVSGIYETEPVGYTEQPAFLNMTAAVCTSLEPLALLRAMLTVEKELGRTRDIRWGPRTIDLDLLLMEDVAMEAGELSLPHPRMMERAFVLVPLRDILESGHPLKERVDQAAALALEDGGEGITLWNMIKWHNESAHSEN